MTANNINNREKEQSTLPFAEAYSRIQTKQPTEKYRLINSFLKFHTILNVSIFYLDGRHEREASE